MIREGYTLKPTPEQEREQERAAQAAIAAHLNALAARSKEEARG
jgi:hypothetical protein